MDSNSIYEAMLEINRTLGSIDSRLAAIQTNFDRHEEEIEAINRVVKRHELLVQKSKTTFNLIKMITPAILGALGWLVTKVLKLPPTP